MEKQNIDFFEAMKELQQGKVIKSKMGYVYYMDNNDLIYNCEYDDYRLTNDKSNFYQMDDDDSMWTVLEMKDTWQVLGHQKDVFKEKELAMYILVNKDIKISKGKLAGQVAHASITWLYRNYIRGYHNNLINVTEEMQNYLDDYMACQKKIILECPQSLLEALEKENFITIRDKGLTELEPNTLTCVCFGVVDKRVAPKWIKELKLYSK